MKFSILMATYNAEKLVARAINSVLAQDYKDYELIIIDGASTDNTLAIVEDFAVRTEKITYISEKDRGIYDALNKGIKMARGEYIHVLGSDDQFIHRGVLSQVADDLAEADFFLANVIIVFEEYGLERVFSNENGYCHQGLFIKNTIMHEHLFDISYTVSADNDLILACMEDESIRKKYVDYPVVYFAVGGESAVNVNIVKDWDRLCDKYHIDKKRIPAITGSSDAKLKKPIKAVLRFLGIYRSLMLKTGRWQPHKEPNWNFK